MNAAVWIGAGVVLLGAIAAFAIGRTRPVAEGVRREAFAEAA